MISDTDYKVLRLINHYDCLTIVQVARALGYSKGSYTYASERLKNLTDTNYLERKLLPHENPRGGPTWVYKLGAEGRKILKAAGIVVPRFAMGKRADVVSLFLRHSLLVNDFFITAHQWARASQSNQSSQSIEIAGMMTDIDFKRDKRFPYEVRRGDGTRAGVIPDGFLDLHIEGKFRECYLLELETGSHEPAAIREKVHDLVLFAQNGYEKVFETPSLTYLFIALGGDDHRKSILKAMAQQLREMERTDLSSLFRVTATPPDDITLFTSRCWWKPGDYDPYPLLD